MARSARYVAVLCSLLVAPAAAAAQPAPPQRPTFTSGTEIVALNVTVEDAQRRFLSGLTADDFVVLEDGVQQPVSFFAAGHLPLDLALLIDASASMVARVAFVQQAASGFVRALRPGDRGTLIEFRDAVTVRQPLTGDLEAMTRAIGQLTPRGGTALYNALYVSLKELDRHDQQDHGTRRKAIVVLSDGEDTASLISYEDVMELARRSGVAIYTISLRSPAAASVAESKLSARYHTPADFAMRNLAQETGGQSFFPLALADLRGVYGRIAEELARQYALGYTPKNAVRDGAFRRILVRVTSVPGARPRTRSGYYADARATRRMSAISQAPAQTRGALDDQRPLSHPTP